MDLGLSGKTAIVTGASRGIGLPITRALIGNITGADFAVDGGMKATL